MQTGCRISWMLANGILSFTFDQVETVSALGWPKYVYWFHRLSWSLDT